MCPAYAYLTEINRNRETVRTERSAHIGQSIQLNAAKLAEIVGGDRVPFEIDEADAGGYYVTWYDVRPETDKEMRARIERGERYNAEVLRRRALKE